MAVTFRSTFKRMEESLPLIPIKTARHLKYNKKEIGL